MNINTVLSEGIRYPNRRRVGRGVGSGLGKTSGKGHKGARARSGWSQKPGYEGGQMPLYRRLPKKGFSNASFTKRYTIVNVGDLSAFDSGARVDLGAILEHGLASPETDRLKVLGNGEIKKKLTVIADRVSASAREKIEKAGGTVEEKETARKVTRTERKVIPSAPKPTRAKTTPAAKAKAAGGGGKAAGAKAPAPKK